MHIQCPRILTAGVQGAGEPASRVLTAGVHGAGEPASRLTAGVHGAGEPACLCALCGHPCRWSFCLEA